jgi:hypothetical protein
MSQTCVCMTNSGVRAGLLSGQVVRRGFYFRASDSRRVQRLVCRSCRRGFSFASLSPCYRQKRRDLNSQVDQLLSSQVSMRRAATLLHTDPKTIARKLLFLAAQKQNRGDAPIRKALGGESVFVDQVFFDEMETSHHTKLKPLSIALAVSSTRVILGFEVSVMPAKGLLAKISRNKYGPRPDERQQGLQRMLEDIRPFLSEKPTFISDECPRYPIQLRRLYPGSPHQRVKGRRGCVVGQGELKKVGFDPLFSLNHTAAMFRANVNRLARRTWCTTKRIDRLKAHLTLYMSWHNRVLEQRLQRQAQKINGRSMT